MLSSTLRHSFMRDINLGSLISILKKNMSLKLMLSSFRAASQSIKKVQLYIKSVLDCWARRKARADTFFMTVANKKMLFITLTMETAYFWSTP